MNDSVTTYGGWHTVDEIVVPAQPEEQLMPSGMVKATPRKSVSVWKPAQTSVDSVARAREDSVIRAVNDSLAREKSSFGIVLQPPFTVPMHHNAVPLHDISGDGLSWVFAGLAILFCVVCMKLKNTPRYIRTLISDIKDVRTRHNMFDNTVKETSFLIILIIGWICCVGILLWQLVLLTTPDTPSSTLYIPRDQLGGIGLCVGVVAVYVIFMLLSYEIAGNVFSDRTLTRIWVKGATASMGLQVFVFFPLSLLTLCYPEWSRVILILSGIVFIIGKIQFIYKGFRIFFNQISSLLLFLYYLCSLEIVPLILAYAAALQICVMWL